MTNYVAIAKMLCGLSWRDFQRKPSMLVILGRVEMEMGMGMGAGVLSE